MKKILSAITISVAMMACNSTPAPTATNGGDEARRVADSLRMAADTAGLAAFQQYKAQNEIALAAPLAGAAAATSTRSTAVRRSSSSNSGGTRSSGSGSTASAPQKKGWSKAAKGAVIGGVAGGAAGAIINKRNRVAGGVIGGIIGAGVGYGVGRAKDKKDGRY